METRRARSSEQPVAAPPREAPAARPVEVLEAHRRLRAAPDKAEEPAAIPASAGPSNRRLASSATILVVDNDGAAAARTAGWLGQNLYEVHVRDDPSEQAIAEALRDTGADLVVLEPAGRGGGITTWRQSIGFERPVLVLSRCASELDRVAGLELGADDYLGKDAHPLELLARVRALLRRCCRQRLSHEPPERRWRLHIARRQLTSPEGKSVALSRSEADLMRVLATRPGEVLSREGLAELLFGRGVQTSARAVDARIARLRRALDALGQRGVVRTVRPQGWVLDPEVAVD